MFPSYLFVCSHWGYFCCLKWEMSRNLYVCLNSFRFHNFNFILFTIVLVYNAILFVYISVLKASNQWKSTEKLVLQISKKTTFNYQDSIPTYLRLGGGQLLRSTSDPRFLHIEGAPAIYRKQMATDNCNLSIGESSFFSLCWTNNIQSSP